MKNKLFIGLLLITFLLIPYAGNAKIRTYDICKEGCEYNNILDVWSKVNLLNDNDDIVINFKDEGPYYYIENETDLVKAKNLGKALCERIGGEYDEDFIDCLVDGQSVKDTEFFGITYISNPKLSSVKINGVSNKTTIKMSPLMDASAFLSALSFSGVLFTDFEMNNIKFDSSVYFANNNEDRQEGVMNNCEVGHAILVFGNTGLDIYNSKLRNVYAVGSDWEEDQYYFNEPTVGNPLILLKNNTNTFKNDYIKYSQKMLNDFNEEFEKYKEKNPEPEYPNLEGGYYKNDDESWQEYHERIDTYNEKMRQYSEDYELWMNNITDFYQDLVYDKFGRKPNITKESILEVITMMISNDGYKRFEDYYNEYVEDNPMPVCRNIVREDYATEEEYQNAIQDETSCWEEYEEWWHGLVEPGYESTKTIFANEGEALLNLLMSIIFPGNDGTLSTIFEISGGNIKFSEYKTKTTSFSSNLSLEEIATELQTSTDDWKLSKEGIIDIKNGKIIPLAVGEVEISKVTDDNYYVVKIVVTPDMLNPKTGSKLLLGLLTISIMTLLGIKSLKRTKKELS